MKRPLSQYRRIGPVFSSSRNNNPSTIVELEYVFSNRERQQFTTFDALDAYIDIRSDDVTGSVPRENVTTTNRGKGENDFAIVETIGVTERLTEEYLQDIKRQLSNKLSVNKEMISYEISIITEPGT